MTIPIERNVAPVAVLSPVSLQGGRPTRTRDRSPPVERRGLLSASRSPPVLAWRSRSSRARRPHLAPRLRSQTPVAAAVLADEGARAKRPPARLTFMAWQRRHPFSIMFADVDEASQQCRVMRCSTRACARSPPLWPDACAAVGADKLAVPALLCETSVGAWSMERNPMLIVRCSAHPCCCSCAHAKESLWWASPARTECLDNGTRLDVDRSKRISHRSHTLDTYSRTRYRVISMYYLVDDLLRPCPRERAGDPYQAQRTALSHFLRTACHTFSGGMSSSSSGEKAAGNACARTPQYDRPVRSRTST